MISASLNALTCIITELRGGLVYWALLNRIDHLPLSLCDELLQTILLLLESRSREVLKSVVGLLYVCIKIFPRDIIQRTLPILVYREGRANQHAHVCVCCGFILGQGRSFQEIHSAGAEREEERRRERAEKKGESRKKKGRRGEAKTGEEGRRKWEGGSELIWNSLELGTCPSRLGRGQQSSFQIEVKNTSYSLGKDLWVMLSGSGFIVIAFKLRYYWTSDARRTEKSSC